MDSQRMPEVRGICPHCNADVQNYKVPPGDFDRVREARESGIDPASGHMLDCSYLAKYKT